MKVYLSFTAKSINYIDYILSSYVRFEVKLTGSKKVHLIRNNFQLINHRKRETIKLQHQVKNQLYQLLFPLEKVDCIIYDHNVTHILVSVGQDEASSLSLGSSTSTLNSEQSTPVLSKEAPIRSRLRYDSTTLKEFMIR